MILSLSLSLGGNECARVESSERCTMAYQRGQKCRRREERIRDRKPDSVSGKENTVLFFSVFVNISRVFNYGASEEYMYVQDSYKIYKY